MRLAKRTGAGAQHRIGGDIAAVENMQRIDQFTGEQLLARRHEGAGGEHIDGGKGQFRLAVAGFTRPDREKNGAGHAVFRLDLLQRAGILIRQRPPAGRQCRKPCLVEIGSGGGKLRCVCGLSLAGGKPGGARSGRLQTNLARSMTALKVAGEIPAFCASGQRRAFTQSRN